MIAYNIDWLDNILHHNQLDEASSEKLISKTEREASEKLFPVGFYSPNIFIRIGLFILTVVITSFSVGLLALITISGSDAILNGLLIFTGLACYAMLEWLIANKKHFQSGVDDALMWCSGVLIVAGAGMAGNLSAQAYALLIFVIAVYFAVRFADRVMALVAMLAVLAMVFFISVKTGGVAKIVLPFLLMLLAAVFYFIVVRMGNQHRYRHYHPGLVVVETAALVCFYFAGNYYVVKEAGNEFLGLSLAEGQGIPFGWIFWIVTLAIPPLYVLVGIKIKNLILIRTGVLLIAMMVFTIRAYHHVLPIETAMFFGGLILIGVSYFVTKLLKVPRGGFTSLPAASSNEAGLKNIEAIIIAETLSTPGQPDDATKFGGGSFGGGGASGEY